MSVHHNTAVLNNFEIHLLH